MTTAEELDEAVARLDGSAQAHLKRLTRNAALLADISFADILVCVPTDETATQFAFSAQFRPINAPTVYPDDLVGRMCASTDRPLLALAWERGELMDGGLHLPETDRWVRTLNVPVRFRDQTIAVLAREFVPHLQRVAGELETTYFSVFRRLAAMVADGTYPYPAEGRATDVSPRVGDGMILLDPNGIIVYASPNALSTLHRLEFTAPVRGRRLSELGLEQRAVRSSYEERIPYLEELEHGDRSVVVQSLPLLEHGRAAGGLVLLRDVSELRRRDRLLLTKDATIAEIHHRVKNNLQTVSSLLRLQGRRVESPEARAAILESEQRIRSITMVHEILSREASDEAPFDEVVVSLARSLEDAVTSPEQPVEITVQGDPGALPSHMATSLAVALAELLQNAIHHGGRTVGDRCLVELHQEHDGAEVRFRIVDHGGGLPAGFDLGRDAGLGLTIVQTLIRDDLGGSLRLAPSERGRGAVATLTAPLPRRPASTS